MHQGALPAKQDATPRQRLDDSVAAHGLGPFQLGPVVEQARRSHPGVRQVARHAPPGELAASSELEAPDHDSKNDPYWATAPKEPSGCDPCDRGADLRRPPPPRPRTAAPGRPCASSAPRDAACALTRPTRLTVRVMSGPIRTPIDGDAGSRSRLGPASPSRLVEAHLTTAGALPSRW